MHLGKINSAAFRSLFFCLLSGVVIQLHASAQPPLLDLSERLHCAASAAEAKDHLSKFYVEQLPAKQLPNEWFGTDRAPSLHAATLDIVLDVLIESSYKYKTLRSDVERVILQWSFCEVRLDREYYDFLTYGGAQVVSYANYSAPLTWRGFEKLGYGSTGSKNYFQLEAYEHDYAPIAFFKHDYHQIHRKQCLPAIVTRKEHYDPDSYFPYRLYNRRIPSTERYPYQWAPACSINKEKLNDDLQLSHAENSRQKSPSNPKAASANETKPKPKVESGLLSKGSVKVKIPKALKLENTAKTNDEKGDSAVVASTEKQKRAAINGVMESDARKRDQQVEFNKQSGNSEPSKLPGNIDLESVNAAINNLLNSASDYGLYAKAGSQSAVEIDKSEASIPKRLAQTIDQIEIDRAIKHSAARRDSKKSQNMAKQQNEEESVIAPLDVFDGGAGSDGNYIVVVDDNNKTESTKKIKKIKKNYGFSGSFTLSNAGFDSDGFSITSGIGYKPIKKSYWFVRGSSKYKIATGDFTYSWGIGYDDWHSGTVAVQLNHWGPLKSGDGLDIDNAVAAVTYKIKSNTLKSLKMFSSLTLSQRVTGDPSLSWSFGWSHPSKFFARASISVPLEGGDVKWAYGFGYADYNPFTFSLAYNNWGPNEAFHGNFENNGIVALTYRWKF